MNGTFVAPRRLLPKLRQWVSAYRSWRFDVLHGVNTRATGADMPTADRNDSLGFRYLPVWPKSAEAALANLPVANLSDYTFVDFGSGKGRMLLLAATLPFRRVIGIELQENLHNQAKRNLSHFKNLIRRSPEVESRHMNALDYEFADDNLVLFFFNPFGVNILEKLLAKLENSLQNQARDVIAIFVHPEYAYVFEQSPFFAAYEKTESCYKYRTRESNSN